MLNYAEVCSITKEQANIIKEKGWSILTECFEEGLYYRKGFAWANRIGYLILSGPVDTLDTTIEEHELLKVAEYDEAFSKVVHTALG